MKRLLSLLPLLLLAGLASVAFAGVSLPAPVAGWDPSAQAVVTKIMLALLGMIYTIGRSFRKGNAAPGAEPVEPGYKTTEFWVTIVAALRLMYGLATTGS